MAFERRQRHEFGAGARGLEGVGDGVLLVDREEVARPFFLAPLLDEVEFDLDADPFPDFADLALADDEFELDEELVRLDLPVEVALERDAVERVLFADFPRAEELFADEDRLLDRDEPADFEALFALDGAVDFAVPFFAPPDLDELDFEAPLFERDEADFDAPLLEREVPDFAVPFLEVDPFVLEFFEPDLELDDFFAVAIFSPPVEINNH